MRHLFFTLLLSMLPALASDDLWLTQLDKAKETAAKTGKGIIIEFTDLDD